MNTAGLGTFQDIGMGGTNVSERKTYGCGVLNPEHPTWHAQLPENHRSSLCVQAGACHSPSNALRGSVVALYRCLKLPTLWRWLRSLTTLFSAQTLNLSLETPRPSKRGAPPQFPACRYRYSSNTNLAYGLMTRQATDRTHLFEVKSVCMKSRPVGYDGYVGCEIYCSIHPQAESLVKDRFFPGHLPRPGLTRRVPRQLKPAAPTLPLIFCCRGLLIKE